MEKTQVLVKEWKLGGQLGGYGETRDRGGLNQGGSSGGGKKWSKPRFRVF